MVDTKVGTKGITVVVLNDCLLIGDIYVSDIHQLGDSTFLCRITLDETH